MGTQSQRRKDPQSLLERLQRWYLRECNGDWEHRFGIKIENLDNPGWMVTIDLVETPWEDLEVNRNVVERSETDWYEYKVTQQKFTGFGGALNLEDVLQSFFDLVEDDG